MKTFIVLCLVLATVNGKPTRNLSLDDFLGVSCCLLYIYNSLARENDCKDFIMKSAATVHLSLIVDKVKEKSIILTMTSTFVNINLLDSS